MHLFGAPLTTLPASPRRLRYPMRRIRNQLVSPKPTGRCPSARRGGSIALQLVFVFPLLLLLTLAVLQTGMWLISRHTVSSAACAAAQTAAKGGDMQHVARTAARALGTNKLQLSADGDAIVVLERYGKEPQFAGNGSISCRPFGPQLQPGELRVTVCVRRGRFAGGRLPNWLGAFAAGTSAGGLQSSSLAAAER